MIMTWDERIFRAVYRGGGIEAVLWAMALATIIGSGWTLVAVAPFLAHTRTRRVAAWLTGTLLITAGLVAGVKAIVRRGRPFTSLHDVKALVFAAPTDPSFPSGHAAGSFAFAVFVTAVLRANAAGDPARERRARLQALGLFAAAGCIALSRVVLGVHYPGDVAAGAALGGACGALGGRAYLARRLALPAADDTQ